MRIITLFCIAYLRVNAICLLDDQKLTEQEFIEEEICGNRYAKRLINFQIPSNTEWNCHHSFIKVLNHDGNFSKKSCAIPAGIKDVAVRKAMCFTNSLSWGFCASPERFLSSTCQTSGADEKGIFNCCLDSLESADHLKCMANMGGYKTYTLEILDEKDELHLVHVSIAEITSCCALYSDYGGHFF
ncbi:Oidioi.mRNA.OKI2018_I69.chr1.g582.t1.cds [Oikopleura dioica]|uniref:Oidioi.mRNA.OKI2018_I69.chr1.g582.t1.cds n=1 Tax=Oikopleura dioica TaxID=34765 RepID=A0ABN7SPN1_OIKDI|nr:Oidioi.mRNA.OKI2018_I69.chr1.g582.t1.cds [Oikopleura dioica]